MLCLTSVTSVYACLTCNSNEIDLARNFYVQMEQIILSSNRIYINIDHLIYETPAIFSDENGYYVNKITIDNQAKSGDCSWMEWECSKCKFCNLRGIDWVCRSCGRPISQ